MRSYRNKLWLDLCITRRTAGSFRKHEPEKLTLFAVRPVLLSPSPGILGQQMSYHDPYLQPLIEAISSSPQILPLLYPVTFANMVSTASPIIHLDLTGTFGMLPFLRIIIILLTLHLGISYIGAMVAMVSVPLPLTIFSYSYGYPSLVYME